MLIIMKVLQKTNRNRDNDQEKICQNPPPNEKETSKKITKRNKTTRMEKDIYIRWQYTETRTGV